MGFDSGTDNIIKKYLLAPPTKEAGKKDKREMKTAGRFLPVRVALLRLLYCKKQISNGDPYLNKALIQKILFEGQIGHLGTYLYDDEKEKLLNPLIQTHPEHKTFFRIKNSDEMPIKISDQIISEQYLIQSLSYWEKQITTESKKYAVDMESIRAYVKFGLETILSKYDEFFKQFSEEQLQKMARSIRDRKFDKSTVYKIAEHIMPLQVNVEARLILDALTYSTYSLVLGYKLNKLKNENEKDTELPRVIVKIVKLLFESQGDDGAWALRNYDKNLMVKDTGLILFLLKEIHDVFPSITIDLELIKKSYKFILNILDNAVAKKEEVVKLETEYLLQVNLYTTVQMIAGYYSATKLLGLEESKVFEHPFVAGFFKYLSKLENNGGYSINEENEPDIETTSFITNVMLGQNAFGLSEKILEQWTSDKFSNLETIGYFQNNTKAITNFLNKSQHLNIVTDCMSALLWCGVWPLSSQILDMLVRTCTKARKDMEDFKKIPLFESKKGQIRLSIHLSPRYWNTITAVHVLHQSILCLMIINDYLDNPDAYWEKVMVLLSDSQS